MTRTAARNLSFVIAYSSEDSYGPCPATLRYDSGDALAVSIDFDPDNVWTFALDVLQDGLYSPSGRGDIRVCSVAGCVSITLKSPEGIIVLLAARSAVEDFLKDVKRAGSSEVDVDGCLAKILREKR